MALVVFIRENHADMVTIQSDSLAMVCVLSAQQLIQQLIEKR
ncbi:hypothetical protein [Providencia rettgeri]|nr:hypothetical protein [Providencia rettgeri]MDI7242387.1 hypothetical protein [Providencia rettgeri]MDY0819480.1 hypothetical protein [Providencia rettgeri]